MRIWHRNNSNVNLNIPSWLILVALVFLSLFAALVWVHYSAASRYQRELQDAINDLREAKGSTLEDERTRQEAVKLRLENEQRTTFLQTLLATLGAGVGLLVTVAGIWIGFAQYLTSKERDRMDRASKDLEHLWEGIASHGDSNKQAAAIAALQHFLSPDKEEYHDRVAAALALAGRIENRSGLVNRTLRPIVESAMRTITESMRKVSWQGLHLNGADFGGIDLRGFDFRDSKLEEANFRGCIISGARFDAASLVRTCFESANLRDASLEYADLADANFRSAKLENANLRHIRLKNLDLRDADLTGAKLSHFDTDWRLSKDWRTAQFPPNVKERLLEIHGPACSGPRVLMLMWEFLPNVSGGAWTAAYHLLRNLRKSGANIVIAVPWGRDDVSFSEFGNEIPVLPLGDDSSATAGRFTTYESENKRHATHEASYEHYGSPLDLSQWFARVALETLDQLDLEIDILHAHDWQTFPAAIALSKRLNCPWVAHFHSLERDRRGDSTNPAIAQIESDATARASSLVVPSSFTKMQLSRTYNVTPNRIEVIPNCLSQKNVTKYPPIQNYASKRVVFIGRFSNQKGPDLFVEIARSVLRDLPQCSFIAYGRGDMEFQLKSLARGRYSVSSPLPQEVAATKAESPERLSSPIDITQIAPVEFDLTKKQIQGVYAEKTGKAKDSLIELVLSRGFTAHAVDHSTYSHVIELSGAVDEIHSRFAIIATGLRETQRSRGRDLVSFPGWLPWERRQRGFETASLIVVPSRAEPFGMIVLEAMEQGIPVLFDKRAGVGEVLESGIRIDPEKTQEVADLIIKLLNDEQLWLEYAESELREIESYAERGYERRMMALWLQLVGKSTVSETQTKS